MSRVFDEVEGDFSCLCCDRHEYRGALEPPRPVPRDQIWTGGAVKAGPLGPPAGAALTAPMVKFCASHNGVLGPPQRSLVAHGVGHSGPHHCARLSWATEVLGDRPFLRAGSHGVFRPQPDGLTQIVGHATKVGATAGTELASWLCPSLLRRPPDGPRRGPRRP
jgi:hypothetical protein